MRAPTGGKQVLRREVLARRGALTATERAEASRKIARRLARLTEFQEAETVLLFASFGHEVDTWELMRRAAAAHKRVVLPRVQKHKPDMELRAVTDLEQQLAPGAMGIMEPVLGCPEVQAAELDLIMLPGVAFDVNGGRLGYGGGYYDRLLARLAKQGCSPALVAIAFEMQIVDEVPMGADDMRVPLIVTEEREIRAAG
jgi:5-formyltetrahydrofolate cyclo-ligase